jgi:Na+/proline symporter
MSTIATQLNWGASYVVQDFYIPFVNPKSSPRRQVMVGRLTMVALAVLGILVTLVLEHSKGVFDLLLQIGAGTGLLYLLRWFWRRINSWSEISAMVVSFAVACFFQWGAKPTGLEAYLSSGWRAEWFDLTAWKLLIGVAVTTACWLAVTFATPSEPKEKIDAFRAKVAGPKGELPRGIVCAALGCVAVWSCLFGTGWLLYGYGGKTELVCRGWVAQGVAAAAAAALLCLVGRNKSDRSGGKAT